MRVLPEHVTHPGAALRVLKLRLAAFKGQRHRHPQLELTWIEAGRGLRHLGDCIEPFGPGDLVLIGPEVPHAWISDGRAGPHAATVMQFPLSLLQQPGLPELARLAPLAARAGRGLRITGPAHAAVTGIPRTIGNPQADADDPQALHLTALVLVLGALHRHADALEPIANSAGPPARSGARRIDAVIEWIHRHAAAPLTVADAARVAEVSPAAFSRYFQREVGKPFTAYLNDLRCARAALALRAGNAPVQIIAAECGLATLSNFNRQFKRRYGTTPRDYRRA